MALIFKYCLTTLFGKQQLPIVTTNSKGFELKGLIAFFNAFNSTTLLEVSSGFCNKFLKILKDFCYKLGTKKTKIIKKH